MRMIGVHGFIVPKKGRAIEKRGGKFGDLFSAQNISGTTKGVLKGKFSLGCKGQY